MFFVLYEIFVTYSALFCFFAIPLLARRSVGHTIQMFGDGSGWRRCHEQIAAPARPRLAFRVRARTLFADGASIDAIFELAGIHWHSLCDLVGTTCGAREYLRRIGWLHALPSAVDSQTLFGVKCLREGLVDDALAG
jgi:hypothetical protein